MRRHNTPGFVSEIMAKFLQRRSGSVLEPCVGEGNLLAPLRKHIHSGKLRAYCVDIDSEPILSLKSQYSALPGAAFVRADFLQLDYPNSWLRGEAGFDSAVVNPPFVARASVSSFPNLRSDFPEWDGSLNAEVAFTLKSVDWLKPGGHLCVVLPGPLVSGVRGSRLRAYLRKCGNIRSVVELPTGTFGKAELKTFIVHYVKGPSRNSVRVCRAIGGALDGRLERVPDVYSRLDFSYFSSKSLLNSALGNDKATLSDFAEVCRGASRPDGRNSVCLHTVHYRDNAWSVPGSFRPGSGRVTARAGDLLVSRVGRRTLLDFGVYSGPEVPLSSCVIRVRPLADIEPVRLLFNILVAICNPLIVNCLRGGSGAMHVSISELQTAPLFADMDKLFANEFRQFAALQHRGDISSAQKVVEFAQQKCGLWNKVVQSASS